MNVGYPWLGPSVSGIYRPLTVYTEGLYWLSQAYIWPNRGKKISNCRNWLEIYG